MWRAKGSGMGFIIEYYLIIVINIASVNLKIIKPKYPVACSRSVGAAGERDLLWSTNYLIVINPPTSRLGYVAPKAPHTRDPGPVKFHIQIQTQIHLQAHIKIHVKVTRKWQPRLDVPSGPGVGLPWPQQHFSSLTRLMGSWGQVWPESGRKPTKTLI